MLGKSSWSLVWQQQTCHSEKKRNRVGTTAGEHYDELAAVSLEKASKYNELVLQNSTIMTPELSRMMMSEMHPPNDFLFD
jgi:hypothetical protein